MQMRLIDADRLKSYIDCGHLRPPTEVCFSELDVCNMIDKAPTVSAEAVDVVRCKDCIHMENSAQFRYCRVWGAINGMGDEGFCNYGERKEA